MATYNNPVAYGKAYAAQNIDALNRTAVCAEGTTVYNGTLVTLDTMNTAAAEGMNYVFPATPVSATTGNTNDIWMVRAPEVPMDVAANLYDDPRAFSVEGGRTFDIIRLMPHDIIHLSEMNFGSNTKPDATTNKYVYSDQNGEWQAASTAAAITGMVGILQSIEPIVVGQDMVSGYIIEIVKNPEATLA